MPDTVDIDEQVHRFDDIECVIANVERFKLKIGAGANTFTSLKVTETLGTIGGVGTSSVAGAGAASWAFGPSWLAAALGASPPIALVVGAAAAAGGVYYGVTSLHKRYYGTRVEAVPKFINSQIDVLGASFLDLVGSLALKVAAIDGYIHPAEREAIHDYFTAEWGYNPAYVTQALNFMEETTEDLRLTDITGSISEFIDQNPDCDFEKVRRGLGLLLTEIAEADGKIDEREEMAVERITSALEQRNPTFDSIKRALTGSKLGITNAAGVFRKKK